MCSWLSQLSYDDWLKLLSLIGAIVVFLVALHQYSIAQRWKKAEFLASEYSKFLNDTRIIKAFLIFDKISLTIPVDKNEIDGTTEFILAPPEKLKSAFTVIADETKRPKDEIFIKLCIDQFLFKIGIFEMYIANKLVKKEQVQTYFKYWLDLIADPKSEIEKETLLLLHKFIKDYHSLGFLKLLERFNYKI